MKLINDLSSCPKMYPIPYAPTLLPTTLRSTNNDSENITYTPQLSAQETAGINIHFSLSYTCVSGEGVRAYVCVSQFATLMATNTS